MTDLLTPTTRANRGLRHAEPQPKLPQRLAGSNGVEA
jgi:hypothetical protein